MLGGQQAMQVAPGGPAMVGGAMAGGAAATSGAGLGFGRGPLSARWGFGGGGAPAGYAGVATGDCCDAGIAGPGDGASGTARCLAACASCGCGSCTCGSCGTSGYTYAVVGQGCGDFIPTTTYKYVGAGAGSVALLPIPGPGCSCWWSLCCLWLLPLLLLLIPDTTTTTTTTKTTTFTIPTPPPAPERTPAPTRHPTSAPTPMPPMPTPQPTFPPTQPPQGPQRECWIYGDPHVRTFDGNHVSFYSAGEYWVVRSDTVWMQGRYAPTAVTNGLSVMKEISIGGPFLQSSDGKKNVLRISALTATWNGVPVIPNFPDSWVNLDPPVKVNTDGSGIKLQPYRQGKSMHVVHVELPLYIKLQVNRWNKPGEGDYINSRIVMSKQPNQDGHCGNFNGNPADDSRLQIRARVGTNGVPPGELLFGRKTPVKPPNRPDLNDCPAERAEHAREICAAKSASGMASSECMIDVCFGGDRFAEHDAELDK